MEDQAFAPSYALAPPPPPPVSKLYLFLSLSVCHRSSFLTGGGGANSHDGEKEWSSINHSILPGRRDKSTLKFHFPGEYINVVIH